MKRFFLSSLTLILSTLAIASTAHAAQTNLQNSAADLNNDGEVSISELKRYNRSERDA